MSGVGMAGVDRGEVGEMLFLLLEELGGGDGGHVDRWVWICSGGS